jgi:DNA ligase-1
MNTPWQIIQDLESHNLRTNKEQIIEANRSNKEFLEGCRMALDSMITFGVKQVSEKTDSDGPGLAWEGFESVAMRLAQRKITGNVARQAVNVLMNTATVAQWNDWYRRILIKDLRCGVSEKTINKVVKNAIPVFSCQLAHDSTNHEEKVCGQKLIEVKLDGVRVLTIVYPDGRVDQFSRNGKELLNFGHIRDQFAKTVTGLTEPVVFDGEVMSSSFQDLMKQVHRKDNVNAGDAVLHLFDFVPLKDFQIGSWDRAQIQRSEKLQAWKDLWADETPSVQILFHELVDLDTDAGQKRFRAINQQAIDGGYEGIMIKEPNAPYECKRTVSWLKLKPFIEVSLTVTNIEEGTGRNVGRLGALVCEGVDDDREISVNVGSGFSDADRDSFWSASDKVLGQIVEVRADAITRNQDGTYSLRFPRFLRFRGFVANEKL